MKTMCFIHDKVTGKFYDTGKMHALNYRGNYFSVDGPLNISRSRQGRPMISHAGTSSDFSLGNRYPNGINDSRSTDNGTVGRHHQQVVWRTPLIFHSSYQFSGVSLPQGSAENVAKQIELWYREGVMDILLIRQDYPAGFEDFIQLVAPILQEKGIFHLPVGVRG